MKLFLQKLGLFFIFSAAINLSVLIAIVFLNQLAVNNCNLADDVNAVIVGDSHTMWSIDASGIKNVDNVSLNAEGYIYTYYKLKHLLENQPNINHVYLGFGYHNMSGYYDDYIYGFQFKSFIHRYIGVMRLHDFVEVTMRNPKDILDILKIIFQNGVRSGLRQECTLYGSFPNERKMETFNSSQMRKRIAEQYFDHGKVIDVSQNNFEYLEKIVTLLRENSIKITLLNTPLHRGYVEIIPQEYKNYFQEFISRNQLEVYSFENLTLTDAQFLPDGDHVNYTGAFLTTEKFREYHEKNYE